MAIPTFGLDGGAGGLALQGASSGASGSTRLDANFSATTGGQQIPPIVWLGLGLMAAYWVYRQVS